MQRRPTGAKAVQERSRERRRTGAGAGGGPGREQRPAGSPGGGGDRGAEEGQPRQPEAGGAAGLLLTWLSSFSAAIRSFGSMVPFSAWMIRLRSISPGGGSAAPGPVGQTAA